METALQITQEATISVLNKMQEDNELMATSPKHCKPGYLRTQAMQRALDRSPNRPPAKCREIQVDIPSLLPHPAGQKVWTWARVFL